MSKFSSLTENRYTLNDIFAKNYDKWFLIPPLMYILTFFVHLVVYAKNYSTTIDGINNIVMFYVTDEFPGDYLKSMISFVTVVSVVLCIIGAFSKLSYNKQNHPAKTGDSIPMLIFLAMCVFILVSSIVNKTGSALLLGFTVRGESLIIIFCYFLVYYFSGSMLKKEKDKNAVIYIFILLSAVLAVLTLIDEYVYDIDIILGFQSVFYHANFYAYFLTMAIMLCASVAVLNENRYISAAAAVIMCINTVVLDINDSLGGFLACIVAFVFMIVAVSIKQKKFSVLSVMMFAAFLLITLLVGFEYKSFFSELVGLGNDVQKIATNAADADEAGTARWGLWKATMEYIKEKPLLGWGLEGTVTRLVSDTGQEKVHNEYLDYMAYFGIPAGLLYIAGLISVFIKALKRRKFVDNATLCCLVASLGYIGSAFVGNRMVFITPFFFIFLGLANCTIDKNNQFAVKAADDAVSGEIVEEAAYDDSNEDVSAETEESISEDLTEEYPEEDTSDADASDEDPYAEDKETAEEAVTEEFDGNSAEQDDTEEPETAAETDPADDSFLKNNITII